MKPTFLTLNNDLFFRNDNFNVEEWQPLLNGEPVRAATADTERGYVDVIQPGMEFPPRCHRLFGRVELVESEWHVLEVWADNVPPDDLIIG